MRTVHRSLTAAACATALTAAAPAAADAAAPSKGLRAAYLKAYERVEGLGGEPGRNIVVDGVRTRDGHRSATRREVVRSLRILRRMSAGLRVARAPGAPATAAAPTASAGLEAIAACESGGNPRAVSPDGRYRGKYQFDMQTWQSVGGSGDPAAAPEAEQDRRAAALAAQRGSSPWPVCG